MNSITFLHFNSDELNDLCESQVTGNSTTNIIIIVCGIGIRSLKIWLASGSTDHHCYLFILAGQAGSPQQVSVR